MARLRKAAAAQPAATTALAARHALREKTNTTRVNTASRNDDSNMENLVKDKKAARSRTRASQSKIGNEEHMMTGGLGQRGTGTGTEEEGVDARTDNLTTAATARGQRRPARAARKVMQSDRDKQVLAEVRKRMEATARGQRTNGPEAVATSQASAPSTDVLVHKSPELSSPPVQDRAPVGIGRRRSSTVQPPGSVLRLQNTPALESSLLALKNFRRRPRQHSILHMVQQRTASARPSAAHVTDREDSTLSGLDLGLDTDDDDVDDFAPDAEGTPIKVAAPVSDLTKSANLRKRSSSITSEVVDQSTTGRSKRQKVAVPISQVPDSQIDQADDDDVVIPSSRRSTSPVDREVLVINSETSSLSSTPPTEPPSPIPGCALPNDNAVIPSTEEGHRVLHSAEHDFDDEGIDQTLADPLSSSPQRPGPMNMAPGGTQAEPLSQFSPPPAHRTAKRTRNVKSNTVLTAALTSLLPKRRRIIGPRARRNNDDFDARSDSDQTDVHQDTSLFEDEEDELARSSRRPPSRAAPQMTRSGRAEASDRSAGQRKAASAAANASKNTAKTTSTTSKPIRRTYGRGNTTLDQENEEQIDENSEGSGVDVSTTMHEVAQGKELEDARKKFAEVDDWAMEFESMSAEDHRSSSQGWR